MMKRDDILRELDAVIEQGLMRTRESFVGSTSGLSEDEINLLLASERRRLELWRDQTLEWILHQAAEPPTPQGTGVTSRPLAAPLGVTLQ